MKRFLLITLIFMLSSSALAYNNEPFIRVHGMVGVTGLPKKYEDDKTYFAELGAGTEIGYKFNEWEWGLFSAYHAGDPGNVELSKQDTGVEVKGSGTISTVAYGPYFKYHIPYTFKGWKAFAGAGPVFSLKSLKLDNYTVDDEEKYDHNHRINFTTIGAEVKLGVMEDLPCKEVHPAYIQLNLGYHRIRKTVVVDASEYTRVEKVSTSDVYGEQVHVFYGFVSVGVTVF